MPVIASIINRRWSTHCRYGSLRSFGVSSAVALPYSELNLSIASSYSELNLFLGFMAWSPTRAGNRQRQFHRIKILLLSTPAIMAFYSRGISFPSLPLVLLHHFGSLLVGQVGNNHHYATIGQFYWTIFFGKILSNRTFYSQGKIHPHLAIAVNGDFFCHWR